MAIVTLAEARAFCGLPSELTAEETARWELLLKAVERGLKRRTGSSLEQATYTHYLPDADRRWPGDRLVDLGGGPGTPLGPQAEEILALPETPVRSVTAVFEDRAARGGQGPDDFGPETELTAGVDYFLDGPRDGLSRTGHLVRVGGGWPRQPRSVKVVYVAGFSADELAGQGEDAAFDASDIKLAALHAVRQAVQASGTAQGAAKYERLGDYAIWYASDEGRFALPQAAVDLLRPFARFAL